MFRFYALEFCAFEAGLTRGVFLDLPEEHESISADREDAFITFKEKRRLHIIRMLIKLADERSLLCIPYFYHFIIASAEEPLINIIRPVECVHLFFMALYLMRARDF